MKNIIRYEIYYGGSSPSAYKMGLRNVANKSMRQNQIKTEQLKIFNLNKSKFITNEQSIVLILSKLLNKIRKDNIILSSADDGDNGNVNYNDVGVDEYFQNLDKLIKGEHFNLIKNTLIDKSQDINQINKYFSQDEVSILQTSNCVGLKFIEVIFNSYGKIKLTTIDEYVLDKIYNLCLPFKDQLLLFENYNSFNPNNEMFDIAKSFFDSKEKIVYSQDTNLSKDEFDLI